MKPHFIIVASDDDICWQAFLDAKAQALRTGNIGDGIEMKRRFRAFLYGCDKPLKYEAGSL